MKTISKIFLSLTLGLTIASCTKEESKPTFNDPNRIASNITADRTLDSGQVYTLGARVSVVSGVTLTIEPGVIIKAEGGSGSNAPALIIARGAKIMAEGTAAAPIIFTSVADNIAPGMIESPNLTPDQNGLWGGVIILGKAKGSFEGNVTEFAVDGIPPTDENGKYGGSDDADNSGVLKYVSIRHGGANIGNGNEINGLTLGCVGSATTIENVEIVGNQDDGIEWFGGTVNVTNAVVWNAGDDAIDTDQAWAGTLNNFVVINAGDKCFELDGPEGAYSSNGHILTNGTIMAENAVGLIDFDDNSDVSMSNIYFTSLKEGQTVVGFDGYAANTSGYAIANFQATLPTEDANGNPANYTTVDFFDTAAGFVTETSAPTVGANMSVFTSWTLAGQKGKLN